MISKSVYSFIILLICASVIGLNCERKNRKLKESSLYANYELHHTEKLPSDKQISTFLYNGQTQSFTYFSRFNNSPLSVTVISCTSTIYWLVKFQPANSSNTHNEDYKVDKLNTSSLQTFYLMSSKGTYLIQLTAIEKDTYAHIYVSTESGGPQALQNLKTNNVLKLVKRRQQKKLSVRWEQSLVDPQVTDYCLVINTQHHYLTYCSAYGAKYGVNPPKLKNKLSADSQTIITWEDNVKNNLIEPLINCVGSRTYFTFTNLQINQEYYFDLFAFNKQSNLTYLYGSSFMVFNKRTKPIRLRDNKLSYVNLKKFDGKVIFQYKGGKPLSDSLKIYIMPCGGAVNIYVSSKGKIIHSRQKIESFGFLVIPNIRAGLRYSIKILSSNNEELHRSSGIEILATTKPSSKAFLPVMPLETALKEYVSLRECDSVTVGWVASTGQRVQYCVMIRELQLNDLQSYKIPNQCGLENRMKKSTDFKAKYYIDIKQENREVIMQKIDHLSAGKHYVVQVTVKKPKGKTLSYDLLQVHTKPTCKTSNTIS